MKEQVDSGMQRQVSPGQATALPMADSDPYPEDFFSKRGVDLPSHLSTKRARWTSLLIVVIVSSFASGPLQSWATLEPILIREGVFAGPDQEAKLTSVYSLSSGIALIAQVFAGMIYDAVGPRATAAWSAFGVVACLIGMACAIQFQSLNFLLWFCYPAAVALGYCNNMGGYAWLYLLPDSRNTVAALIGVIQILSDSLVLVAVFLHDTLGVSMPVYFALCAFLSLLAGVVCLMLIPEHAITKEVAYAVVNPDEDVESGSYGAADSSVKKEVESCWQVVKRGFASLRDCWTCFLFHCPGAWGCYTCFYCFSFMSVMYPQIVMYPFYQALLGSATATTLVNIKGGLYAGTGAVGLLLFGKFVDLVGFRATVASLSVPIILNFALFCTPNFVAQVIGLVVLALQSNPFYVLISRWCLCYLPPELYGSGNGSIGATLGVFQMVATPFGTFASNLVDKLVTGDPFPAMKYLTTMGIWCFLSVLSALAYVVFTHYYPMPAPGGTTMAEVTRCTQGATSDREAEHLARRIASKQELPAGDKQSVQKSSTPT